MVILKEKRDPFMLREWTVGSSFTGSLEEVILIWVVFLF